MSVQALPEWSGKNNALDVAATSTGQMDVQMVMAMARSWKMTRKAMLKMPLVVFGDMGTWQAHHPLAGGA